MPAEDNDTRGRRESDMILAPNEYAYISDETKGDISVYVGPNKTSLAGTDRCVVFDEKTKRFKRTDLAQGVQTLKTAPEGWYLVLKNPADKVPTSAGKLTTPELKVGRKVNIPGPVSFALWPGQMAKVIQGHHLRSNEYLVVRVYDEEAARKNFNNGVIKLQNDAAAEKDIIKADALTMGQLLVIKGTTVAFYIPPTGIEVVTDDQGRYIREAVTLERLEYCLLLDQDGNKRYEEGPAVVFPRPTEKFVEKPIKSDPDRAKAKKFRAVELSETSGIYVKVTADYTDTTKDGKTLEYKVGDELFITGKDQMIYFPRDEHAIIKYGDQEIHYGIAIPAGEARYVLNRKTGTIRLEKGPSVFLPDPRYEVIVKRGLPLSLVELLYPGNHAAMEHNAKLLGESNRDIFGAAGGEHMLNNTARYDESYAAVAAVAPTDTDRKVMIRGASKAVAADAFDRKNKYTEPRSIVLNTRFDGAVTVDVWTGFAVKLVSKDGSKRIVVGPQTAMLEYDENPQVLTLSRGKPKNSDNPLKTVYLRVSNNRVGDAVEVETRDFVKVMVSLSYRLNFVGDDPNKWFEVEDYVKFLCDNMRSRIRNAVRKLRIEEFYSSSESTIRDIVLGKAEKDGDPRPGTRFAENAMHVYDAEVLSVRIMAQDVEQLLVKSQRDAIHQSITLEQEKRKFSHLNQIEDLKQEIEKKQADTLRNRLSIEEKNVEIQLEVDIAKAEADKRRADEKRAMDIAAAQHQSQLSALSLKGKADEAELTNAIEQKKLEIKRALLEAEAEAVVTKAKAITPDFIAALQAFGDKALIEKVASAMAPMALLGAKEEGILPAISELLKGTQLGNALTSVAAPAVSKNGKGATA